MIARRHRDEKSKLSGVDDNPYYTIEPAPPFEPSPLAPGELFRGPYWSVYLEDETYVLGYISGELAGRFKRLEISKSEADQLMAGAISCESVLLAHGAG